MNSVRTQKMMDLFETSPTIASQMPIVFPAKELEWSELTCTCNKCDQDIPDDMVRGSVSSLIPSVISMSAIGYCPYCNLLVQFDYRFRDNGSIEWQHEGQWVRSFGRKTPLWTRLTEGVKRLKAPRRNT